VILCFILLNWKKKYLEELLPSRDARSILEIGTAIGYSTVYLARGAGKTGGKVLTIDMNKGRLERAACKSRLGCLSIR